MAQYRKSLRDDSDDDMDDDADNDLDSRRLSLKITDLPVAQYCDRWTCCSCFKATSSSYANLLEDEYGSTPSDKQKKAQETMLAEQALDATVKKIVGNLSWVNATMLAVAMKNTLNIEFSNTDADHSAANNAWIYFFVIFGASIVLALSFRLVEDLDEMQRELELKTTEKLNDLKPKEPLCVSLYPRTATMTVIHRHFIIFVIPKKGK